MNFSEDVERKVVDDDIPVLISTDTDTSKGTHKGKSKEELPKKRLKASERKLRSDRNVKSPQRKLKFPTSSGIACTEPCAHPRCLKMCMHELDQKHDSHY